MTTFTAAFSASVANSITKSHRATKLGDAGLLEIIDELIARIHIKSVEQKKLLELKDPRSAKKAVFGKIFNAGLPEIVQSFATLYDILILKKDREDDDAKEHKDEDEEEADEDRELNAQMIDETTIPAGFITFPDIRSANLVLAEVDERALIMVAMNRFQYMLNMRIFRYTIGGIPQAETVDDILLSEDDYNNLKFQFKSRELKSWPGLPIIAEQLFNAYCDLVDFDPIDAINSLIELAKNAKQEAHDAMIGTVSSRGKPQVAPPRITFSAGESKRKMAAKTETPTFADIAGAAEAAAAAAPPASAPAGSPPVNAASWPALPRVAKTSPAPSASAKDAVAKDAVAKSAAAKAATSKAPAKAAPAIAPASRREDAISKPSPSPAGNWHLYDMSRGLKLVIPNFNPANYVFINASTGESQSFMPHIQSMGVIGDSLSCAL